jgi:chitosanase
MDAFQRLIDQGYWGLDLPLVVRGREISTASLNKLPPGCYGGPQAGTRSLAITSPMQRGLDVRLVQLGLSDRGFDIMADGVFGQTSAGRVREFQEASGRPVNGIADAGLISQLVS